MVNMVEISQAEYERLCKIEAQYRNHLSMLRTIVTQGGGMWNEPNCACGLDPDRSLIEPNPETKANTHV